MPRSRPSPQPDFALITAWQGAFRSQCDPDAQASTVPEDERVGVGAADGVDVPGPGAGTPLPPGGAGVPGADVPGADVPGAGDAGAVDEGAPTRRCPVSSAMTRAYVSPMS